MKKFLLFFIILVSTCAIAAQVTKTRVVTNSGSPVEIIDPLLDDNALPTTDDYVWTANGTTGEGHWQPGASGIDAATIFDDGALPTVDGYYWSANGTSGTGQWLTLPVVAVDGATVFNDGALPTVDGYYWSANGTSGIGQWLTLPVVAVSGSTIFNDGALPTVDGYYWSANGTSGTGDWTVLPPAGITSVAADTTPELGGDLDLLTHDFVSSTARDIRLLPDAAGDVVLGLTNSLGRVGIGVTNPAYKLQIISSAANNVVGLGVQQNAAQAGLFIDQNAARWGLFIDHTGGSDDGIEVNINGTGRGVQVNHTGTGIGVEVVKSGTSGSALSLSLSHASNTQAVMSLRNFNSSGAALAFVRPDNGGFTTVRPDNATANWTLELPPDDGDANEVLTTNGSGDATWTYKGSMKKETADPCATLVEADIFYNDTSNYMCYCDGTNDVQVHSPATACF